MSAPVTATAAPPTGNPLAVDEGVKPTIPLLLGIFVAHVVIWIGLIRLLPGDDRVSFEFLGDQSTPWVRQFIIPLLVVLAFQAAVITKLGWWKSVMRDPVRTDRKWLWVFPVVLIVLALLTFASEGAQDAGSGYLVSVLTTTMLVGITEEMTFRGIMLVGARRLFDREWRAVVFSGALFGLFHLPNILVGAPAGPTVLQVFQTAIIGTAIYALRRTSGALVLCMLLHGVYDYLVLQGNWDKVASALL